MKKVNNRGDGGEIEVTMKNNHPTFSTLFLPLFLQRPCRVPYFTVRSLHDGTDGNSSAKKQ